MQPKQPAFLLTQQDISRMMNEAAANERRQIEAQFNLAGKTAALVFVHLGNVKAELMFVAGAVAAGKGRDLAEALRSRDESLGAAWIGFMREIKPLKLDRGLILPLQDMVSAHIAAIQDVMQDRGDHIRATVASYGDKRMSQLIDDITAQVAATGRPAGMEPVTAWIADQIIDRQRKFPKRSYAELGGLLINGLKENSNRSEIEEQAYQRCKEHYGNGDYFKKLVNRRKKEVGTKMVSGPIKP